MIWGEDVKHVSGVSQGAFDIILGRKDLLDGFFQMVK